MKRVNGFIDINLYFKELGESESTLEEKGLVRKSDYFNEHQYWITLEGKEYYFKQTNAYYRELLCSQLAKMLDIEALDYDLATYNGYIGVISESYRKEGNIYVSGHHILANYYNKDLDTVNEMGLEQINWEKDAEAPYYFHMNNLMTIWQALEVYYPYADISYLLDKIINQFIFAILTEQIDKGAQNWEIEESFDNVDVVPLYDNEGAYFGLKDEYGLSMAMSTDYRDYDATIIEVLRNFLNTSSNEYVELFLNKFNTLDEEMLEKALKNIEIKTGIEIPEKEKSNIYSNFIKHQMKIENLLNELGLLNNIKR